jgi:predicted nuclease of restriction endonuclease-like (RecB) superfamily
VTRDILPSDYHAFLQSIKTRVQQAQLKAVVAVNTELIMLYWQIGREILERQGKEGWGTGVIDRLAKDLHAAFPQMKGFSPRNLGYMKRFAQTYPDASILQQAVAKLPWGHNILVLEKVKDATERLWYVEHALQYGWSRNVLDLHIETKLYHRQGKALTNFSQTLPALDSDLATEALKDPYIFDFITTTDETKERNVQSLLLANIRQFLLELGVGFTFVGSNYHIVVGGEDYYIDLLFYHISLRCFVVIELKAGSFKPEFVGKLNFYMTAIDRQVKAPEDNRTIGIILCKTKNKVTAEYALANIHNPMGVATYQTTEALPEDLQDKLPALSELAARLEEVPEESEEAQAK